jgi:hypothetical protein
MPFTELVHPTFHSVKVVPNVGIFDFGVAETVVNEGGGAGHDSRKSFLNDRRSQVREFQFIQSQIFRPPFAVGRARPHRRNASHSPARRLPSEHVFMIALWT